ncbi:MAG: metallophosphoesterase [Campylobacterota bacterium]|nr:metallophosphoesterase [Campylobacterota bacterium]
MKIPIIFPILLITLMFAIHYLFYSRVIKRLHVCPKTLTILKALVGINFVGIIGYMISRYAISVPQWLYFVFSLSFAVVLAFVVIGIMYEVLHLLQSKLPFDEEKRKFFKRSSDMGILALGGAYLGRGVYEGQKEPMVVDVKLNQKLFSKSYGIVQISDMHIGGLIDSDFVQKSVERINALNPDLVAITGDLTDAHIDSIKEAVDQLANIQSRFGTFYVVGNHEYFHGFEDTVAYINKKKNI